MELVIENEDADLESQKVKKFLLLFKIFNYFSNIQSFTR
jgi:hypothetical protein